MNAHRLSFNSKMNSAVMPYGRKEKKTINTDLIDMFIQEVTA